MTKPLCVLTLAFLAALAPVRAAERLNFIFVLIDDMGLTDAACYGSKFYETPQIDRLAHDGVKFTAAYSACTVCSPTRAALTAIGNCQNPAKPPPANNPCTL